MPPLDFSAEQPSSPERVNSRYNLGEPAASGDGVAVGADGRAG